MESPSPLPSPVAEPPRVVDATQRMLKTWLVIAETSATCAHPLDLFQVLDRRIGDSIGTDGWVVAQFNAARDDVSFAHSSGTYALPAQRLTRLVTPQLAPKLSMPGAVLYLDAAAIDELLGARALKAGDPKPQCGWIGAIRDEAHLVGFTALWAYDTAMPQRENDALMLRFVSHHVALALSRRRAEDSLRVVSSELERRVEQRTRELAEANAELRRQADERERAEQKLKHDALHDALTGLPNRVLMRDRLEHALARFRRDHNQAFGVLYMDLDRFKVINDSMGHAVGDALLIEVGRRIVASLREEDTVARLGGDEFAVLLPGVRNASDASIVAKRLIAALAVPVQAEGKELFTSTSIGVALSDPRYKQPDEMLRDADAAMYRAKSNGRQTFEVFDEALHEQARRLLDLEGELRHALANDAFSPFYQVIVDLRDGTVLGHEALLRWRHPKRGWLAPGDFLSVAEEIGLSEQIDRRIFDRACADLAHFAEEHYVSINVSPRHFRDKDLPARLNAFAEQHGITTDRLRLKITEGTLLTDPAHARRMLETLAENGFVALLDDFGTGYSSLSYLHQFPIHALKIDRSFVAALTPGDAGGSHAVVEAVLSLAQSLGVEVIAEGIETVEQRDALLALGCTQGQGYYFGKPRPVQPGI
jgi:diguanylate cyclase (GGDEF)-like protein